MEFHPQLHPDAVLTYTADSATKKNDAKRCIMKQDDIEDEYESDCVIIRSKRRTQPHRKSTRNPKSMKLSADDHEGECELDNFAQNGYDIDPNIVFNDPFNKCEVVLDRLCWLNQKVIVKPAVHKVFSVYTFRAHRSQISRHSNPRTKFKKDSFRLKASRVATP